MTRQWIEVIHTPKNQAGHLQSKFFTKVSAASGRPTKTVATTDRNKVLVREKSHNVHIMKVNELDINLLEGTCLFSNHQQFSVISIQ